MGPNLTTEERQAKSLARLQEQVEAFFEPQLASLGLSVAAIENQDLDQLRASLERVNDLIANPGQLGTFRIRSTGTLASLTSTESTFEVGVLPLLLVRKRLILDRIAVLGGQAQASTLRDLVGEVKGAEIQSRLRKEIDQLVEQSSEYLQEKRQVENAERIEEIRMRRRLSEAQFELEQSERRAVIRQRFLERESVATIVGGFLLVLLTCMLIVAMFIGTTVPEILSNGFFIILGYFFGQTAGRVVGRSSTAPTDGAAAEGGGRS